MPPRGCWGRSTGRTPQWLPPWTQKRVALVSRAPKIVRPRRPNKHGTRQNEVRQPAQLPRGARRAAGGGARRGSEVGVRDAGARHARAARRGSHTRGPAPDARARGSVAQVAHAGLPHVRPRRHRRRAVPRAAREPGLRARHRDLLVVRASSAAVLRQGARGLPAERPARGIVQDPTRDRGVRPPAAGTRAPHRPGGRCADGRARAPRRGRRDRGLPPLHDDARRREAEFEDGHQRATRGPAPGRQDPRRVPETGARRVSDGPLSGKLALVTGASRGIGRAVADRLYVAGAHVVRLARSLTDGSTERRTDLRGMHEVLRQDLSRTGVRTTLVSPGPVDTPIWDPVDPDSKPGFTKRSAMLQAEDIAAAVLYAVTQAPRVDVTEIRLMPTVYTARG